MREWLFASLYGSLFIVGAFLSPFWGFIAYRRARWIGRRWTLRSDRYFMLALAICTLSTGDTIVFATRTITNFFFGLSPALQNNWTASTIAVGLAICLLGKGMMVWIADLEKEPPVWTWTRWIIATTIGWALTSAALELIHNVV